WARKRGDQIALNGPCVDGRIEITWQELDLYSDRLAAYLAEKTQNKRYPIIVYGHKSPWMIISFLACVKSGHTYCPVDSVMPHNRVMDIVAEIDSPFVICVQSLELMEPYEAITLQCIESICKSEEAVDISQLMPIQDDETYYILFTSGSSGKPKGVQISKSNVFHFVDWMMNIIKNDTRLGADPTWEQPLRVMNQVPLSFDVSVMDTYIVLMTGGTWYALGKEEFGDYQVLYDELAKSEADIWVSTPSFAEVCMADPIYNSELMPNMRLFLFCGETFGNNTYEKLYKRFPEAEIYNTYGPTEATVAVSEVKVTPELSEKYRPLPVGRAKPGIKFLIEKDGEFTDEENVKGEVIIAGDTVSRKGYLHRPDLTEKAFFKVNWKGEELQAYRTADEGYLADGMLFYGGRLDFQIKLHGYRIELGDIESNMSELPNVQRAVVLPTIRKGEVKSLKAYVQSSKKIEDEFAEAQNLRQQLAKHIPEYMVPKRVIFVDQFPMNQNGKIDRRALEKIK
ncbi:MAG: D-alanine--poly(phosphoribitol) ligase subunit DltA, partial [Clostridiaceae bacterium]|nr:D-alanine--poly(phosphoribitol) ligase subunit DltA [Clostridiaceae bacterium]